MSALRAGEQASPPLPSCSNAPQQAGGAAATMYREGRLLMQQRWPSRLLRLPAGLDPRV